eukprot:6524137-Prymnesium_polylepis.1
MDYAAGEISTVMLIVRAAASNALLLADIPNGQRSFLPGEPPVLVDLRARAAFEDRHLTGSCHVPLASLQGELGHKCHMPHAHAACTCRMHMPHNNNMTCNMQYACACACQM